MPCESTGYSPFKILYGRTVRGPLAIVNESWVEKRPTEGNIVSHVLEIRRRLATMQEIVKKNLKRAQSKQKRVYDAQSSHRRLEVSDKALVLLPSLGDKLEMRWEGPYKVTKVLKGGLNYELDTGKVRKHHRTYDINLLSKWQSRDEITSLVFPKSPDMSLPHENHVPSLDNEET